MANGRWAIGALNALHSADAAPVRSRGSDRCEGDAARNAPSPYWLPPHDRCMHMRLGYQPGFGVRARRRRLDASGNRALRIRYRG